jgi:hypothetical protein
MKYILLIFVSVLVLSCFNEGDCLITATNVLHIQFKKRSNSDTLNVTLASIVIDKVVIPPPAKGTEILLPLNKQSDSTLLVFNRANTGTLDSILVGYVRQAKVISKECGAYTYFQNLTVLKTKNLDSGQVKVLNNNLLKDPTSSAITAYAVNLQIFY